MPVDQSSSLNMSGMPLMMICFTSLPVMVHLVNSPAAKRLRSRCVCVQTIMMASSTKREMTVAMAAPRTPMASKPKWPKIST